MMNPLTLVAFGDSLTYGYGVLEHVAYPTRLGAAFPGWTVINSGVNGDTSREAKLRLQEDVLVHQPHVVIFFFGSNDCALNEDYYRPLLEYEKSLRAMTESVLSFSHGDSFHGGKALPIFITPPPVVDTDFFPFTTTDRVALYAQATEKIGAEFQCPVIDFFSALLAKKEEAYEDFFQFDGIHLSNQGYDLLYALIYETLKQHLNF